MADLIFFLVPNCWNIFDSHNWLEPSGKFGSVISCRWLEMMEVLLGDILGQTVMSTCPQKTKSAFPFIVQNTLIQIKIVTCDVGWIVEDLGETIRIGRALHHRLESINN